MPLSSIELMNVLNYSSETGNFTWKKLHKFTSKAKVGGIAGVKTWMGTIHIKVGGKVYQAHRLAWLYIYGEFPKGILDHKNNIRSDNRISNLREATLAQNCHNKKATKRSKSGVKGCFWDEKNLKWKVSITMDGKYHHVGRFDNIFAAAAAYDKAARSLQGEFAKENNLVPNF